MASWRDLALPAAAALEGTAIHAALRGGGDALALALHAAACGAVAAGLRRRPFEGPAGSALAFVLALFVPVLGAAGLLAAARLDPRSTFDPERDLVHTPIPCAADAPANPPPPAHGAPALARLSAARERRDAGAITLLRRSLVHPDEDVRLIAFSVLESKSRAAYREVHEAARALEGAPPERRGALLRDLAARHWEIARLGLAEGECLGHALGEAQRHARAALEREPDRPSLHLLLGRIQLRRGEAREAEAALGRAVALGLPATSALPYLAEAAFLDRRLDLVRRRLAALPPGGSLAVDRVRRFWA